MSGSDKLTKAVQRWRQYQSAGVDQAPACVFGLMTRDAVDDLRADLERVNESLKVNNRLLIGLMVTITTAALGLLISGVIG